MSVFVIGYYALLLAVSCLAAYFNKRKIFVLIFSLTLVSFVLGIIGGAGALKAVAICAGLLGLTAMVSYAFREFLILLADSNVGVSFNLNPPLLYGGLLLPLLLFVVSSMMGWPLKEIAVALLIVVILLIAMTTDTAKELRTAPLTASFGMFVVFTYAIAGIFAPYIAPFGEAEIISSAFDPPDENLLLGADQLGRDMFSRIIYGARNSVSLALMGTLLAFILGALAGLLAAVNGGVLDQSLSRIADVIMSIPSLIFSLLMVSVFKSLQNSPEWLSLFNGDQALADFVLSTLMMGFIGLLIGTLALAAAAQNAAGWLLGSALGIPIVLGFALGMATLFDVSYVVLILVVAIIYAPRVFRLTRAVAGNIVVMDYIEAAQLRGESKWYLIRREVLPNSTAPLVAEFGLEFCFVFLLVAGLSFLGLGIQPPTADWGSMVRENATLISFGDITPLIPAAAIALLTVAVNFVVDWMLFRSSGLKEQ